MEKNLVFHQQILDNLKMRPIYCQLFSIFSFTGAGISSTIGSSGASYGGRGGKGGKSTLATNLPHAKIYECGTWGSGGGGIGGGRGGGQIFVNMLSNKGICTLEGTWVSNGQNALVSSFFYYFLYFIIFCRAINMSTFYLFIYLLKQFTLGKARVPLVRKGLQRV